MRASQLAGGELQPDASGPQLLSQRRQLDAVAEPLVLVHDDRDRDPGRAQFPGQGDRPVKLGPVTARAEIFSEKTRVTLEAPSESTSVSRTRHSPC